MSERYVSQRVIGEGRAGEVHEAQDTMLDRKVAMRRFPKHILDLNSLSDDWKNQFMEVVGGLSRVSHPNILRMIDGGIDEQGPYLISILVEGLSLTELSQSNAFDVADAYDLARQVLESLLIAKEEGFFHLALSPTSVIATKKGKGGYNFTLTDLGHSKLLPLIYGTDRAISMTQTPALVAPELYEGKPQGEKTVQFILGQLIYWILAKGHPYGQLSTEEAYLKYKEGQLESLVNYRMEVPQDLLNWLSVVMRADPDQRFADIASALQALPPSPARFFAKKVSKPPTPIRPEDLGSIAPALPYAKRRKKKRQVESDTTSHVV